MGISLFPWQLICVAHPSGHDHHKHDGPSTCDLHRIYAGAEGEYLLPPMDCEHISPAVDDYNRAQVEKTAPPLQLVAFAAILLDLVKLERPEKPFLIPPDPKPRSATLLSDIPLRAPPLD